MAQQTFEELVAAVKQAESRGKRYAADGKTLTTSPKGALGEMQVMPKTIKDPGFGVIPAKSSSPDEIARVGVDYLQAMTQKYGDTEKALIAYNWGPGSTDKWIASGADPKKLPQETKTYVERVKGFLGKDVPRETMAKKEREPLPESLPPMAKADQAQPAPAPTKVTMAKMDVKSMPASYQAAFALAALADAQDEEDDRAYNENKQTETEEFFANYKPVNKLASLDLSVTPVMMKDGGDVEGRPRSAKSLMEKFKDLTSEYQKDPIAFMRHYKVPTSPMGQGLNAGYAVYKHVTGKDPLLDLQKELSQRLNPETDTGDADSMPIAVGLPPVKRADGSPEEGERKDEPIFDAASRTYVDVLTGRRTPITEKDFTAKEQMAMMDAVRRSQARGGKGRVDYQDYPSGDQIGPGFVDIRNTLGGFQYKQNPDGSTVISDRYDFHGPRAAEYEKMGTGEKVLKSAKNALSAFVKSGGGVRDAAGELGDAWIGSKGPQVNIRIPVKRADGSPEEGERLTPQQIERLAMESNTPATVNPNIRKQGEAARKLAAMRDVNTLPDPKTYAVMQGLLGTRPDEMGFSVLNPKLDEIKAVAEPAFAAGTALQIAPALQALGLGKVPGVVGGELNRRLLAGESLTPGFNTPAPINFIRRPAGGVFPTAKSVDEEPISGLDKSIKSTLDNNLSYVRAPAENKEAAKQFMDTKLRDYFKTKASSVSDPLREALINGRIKIPKDSPLEEQFPQALINASRAGDVTAMREIENRFDKMMNISNYRLRPAGTGPATDREATEAFKQTILQQMKANPSVIPDEFLLRLAKKDTSKLSKQEQAAEVAGIRQKLADNPTLFNTVIEPKMTRLLSDQMLETVNPDSLTQFADLYPALVNAPKRQEGIMALQADVPITDVNYMGIPEIFGISKSDLIEELTKISPKDLAQMSVPEFYAKAIPSVAKKEAFRENIRTVDKLAKEGKPVPAEIGQFGTKEFLPTDSNGMTWREITDPKAALIQAKFLNNSIGGYAEAGTYGPLNKGLNALKDGETRLFSLYDKNGHAVNNVEFITPEIAGDKLYGNKANTITQMNGNGVRTGNVVPEQYAEQMLDLVNALNPKDIPLSIKQLFQDRGLTPNPLPTQRADGGMIERQPTDNRRYL